MPRTTQRRVDVSASLALSYAVRVDGDDDGDSVGDAETLDATAWEAWEAGVQLARLLAASPSLVRGRRVLELGCGCSALPGITAALLGAAAVTISDHDGAALEVALRSARANGATAVAAVAADWTDAPRCAAALGGAAGGGAFDVVLAADVAFATSLSQRLADVVAAALPAGATDALLLVAHRERFALVGVDTDGRARVEAEDAPLAAFQRELESHGLHVAPRAWQRDAAVAPDTGAAGAAARLEGSLLVLAAARQRGQLDVAVAALASSSGRAPPAAVPAVPAQACIQGSSIRLTCFHPEVYEPSEDSFELADAAVELIGRDAAEGRPPPRVVLEVGAGTGFVLAAAAVALQSVGAPPALLLATDLNPHAADAARRTVASHGAAADAVQADLAAPLAARLAGAVDLLLFNPPYVPSPPEEVGARGLPAAWAGGERGRVVVDRFLPQVAGLLARGGRCLMIAVAQNDVPDLCGAAAAAAGLRARVVRSAAADEERLSVIEYVAAQQY